MSFTSRYHKLCNTYTWLVATALPTILRVASMPAAMFAVHLGILVILPGVVHRRTSFCYMQWFLWWYTPIWRTGTFFILQANFVKNQLTACSLGASIKHILAPFFSKKHCAYVNIITVIWSTISDEFKWLLMPLHIMRIFQMQFLTVVLLSCCYCTVCLQ